MRRLLACLVALVLACLFVTAPPASAANFNSPGWWDVPNYTGAGDPQDKWLYADHPIRCENAQPSWTVIFAEDDGSGLGTGERDGIRTSMRRAMSAYTASARMVFSSDSPNQNPRLNTFTQGNGTCQPSIFVESMGTTTLRDFGAMKSTLRARGYNSADSKYFVYADTDNPACCTGISDGTNDSSLAFTNDHNDGDMFSVLYAESGHSEYGDTVAHEMAHNMGAVSSDAPHGDPDGHTYKNQDLMADIFIEAGDFTDPDCANSNKYLVRFDCESTDYFMKIGVSTNRPSGYLATHWAVNDNRFMWGSYPSKPS